MMRPLYAPTISEGVLLARLGDVHRQVGRETACGKRFTPGRVAAVSHVQAIVHKLRLCRDCYPDHHAHRHHAGVSR